MPWAVKFHGKNFMLDDAFDPDYESEFKHALSDRDEVPGSVSIVFHGNGAIEDITFKESDDPDALPFTGVHGKHPELGETYIFHGTPDDGDGQVIVLYENVKVAEPAFNEKRFPLKRTTRKLTRKT